jgi:hypothetical protein
LIPKLPLLLSNGNANTFLLLESGFFPAAIG